MIALTIRQKQPFLASAPSQTLGARFQACCSADAIEKIRLKIASLANDARAPQWLNEHWREDFAGAIDPDRGPGLMIPVSSYLTMTGPFFSPSHNPRGIHGASF